MIDEEQLLVTPEDDAKLWRYMDFAKFMTIVENGKLFFTRGDKFEDDFEGSYSAKTIENRKETYSKYMNANDALKRLSALNEQVRKGTYINCWFLSKCESSAMWELYSNNRESIAIQTTVKRLVESLISEDNIFVGEVHYIDYEKDIISESNTMNPFLYKRDSFSHEKEVRAIFQRFSIKGNGLDLWNPLYEYGAEISIDIEWLIENIFVSPNAPDWFVELVKSILGKYGLDIPVLCSGIKGKPKF